MPKASGTFNLWIDRTSNPDAFSSGVRCRWGSFEIDGETCCVVSEGSTLAGILRGATPNQVRLFDIPFAVDRQSRHLVTIGWKGDKLRIFLDSKLLAEIPLLISN